MWSIPKNEIPQDQIKREHLRVLEEAVKNSTEFDVRTKEVYVALDYLQSKSLKTWGITVYREALELHSPSALAEGLRIIKQHLGV